MRSHDIDGVLLIDKAPGMTSHDVVAIVRKRLGFKKVGHCGTLDPLATGLLLIRFGPLSSRQNLCGCVVVCMRMRPRLHLRLRVGGA